MKGARWFAGSVVVLAALLAWLRPWTTPTTPSDNVADNASAAFVLQALERLERGGFETLAYVQAVNLLDQAKAVDPDEPRVWIAYSQIALNRGYRIGDRYREDSFDPEFLRIAADWAQKGLDAVPEEPMAHVQMAKIQIIKGQLREAWMQVDHARRLDLKAFYPWYLRGIISRRMRDTQRAKKYFAEADVLAGEDANRRHFVRDQMISVALQDGDETEAERLHRMLAEAHPPSAHERYNFGLFLLARERKQEAIEQFELAGKIAMFPALRKAMEDAGMQVAE